MFDLGIVYVAGSAVSTGTDSDVRFPLSFRLSLNLLSGSGSYLPSSHVTLYRSTYRRSMTLRARCLICYGLKHRTSGQCWFPAPGVWMVPVLGYSFNPWVMSHYFISHPDPIVGWNSQLSRKAISLGKIQQSSGSLTPWMVPDIGSSSNAHAALHNSGFFCLHKLSWFPALGTGKSLPHAPEFGWFQSWNGPRLLQSS